MRQSVRHQTWIILAAVIVFFTNLGITRLWDQDEAYFARCAVEMHQRGEWVVPYFNDELFAHKPPFMFWMMRLGFTTFGVSEFSARFFSGVFGVLCGLLVYHLGKRLYSASVGLWAGLAITTCVMFDVVGRAATADSFLVFFVGLAIYIFARWENWETESTDGAHALREPLSVPLPWKMSALMYAVMGMAVLVKGPIGVVLPTAILGLYLLVRHPLPKLSSDASFSNRIAQYLSQFAPTRIVRTAWKMRPLTALAAVIAVAGPWFVLVGIRTNGEFLNDFFGVHNYGRFLNPMDNHNGPLWYYVPVVLFGFFPWTIFGIPTTVDLVRRVRGNDSGQKAAKLLACWIAVWIGFFSLASTKLPNYVLPAYPALAIAMSCFLNRWLTRPQSVHRWWPRLSFGSLALVGGGLMTLKPVLSLRDPEGQTLIEKIGTSVELLNTLQAVSLLGLVLVIGAGVCLILSELRRRMAAGIALGVTAVAFSVTLFAYVAVQIDQYQPNPDLAKIIHDLSPTARPHLAQRGYFRPSLIYYANNRVEQFETSEEASAFLDRYDDAFLITTETEYVANMQRFPLGTTIVGRHPEFPRSGTILILARPANLAKRSTGPVR